MFDVNIGQRLARGQCEVVIDVESPLGEHLKVLQRCLGFFENLRGNECNLVLFGTLLSNELVPLVVLVGILELEVEPLSQVVQLLNSVAFEVVWGLLVRLAIAFGCGALPSGPLGVVVVYNFGHLFIIQSFISYIESLYIFIYRNFANFELTFSQLIITDQYKISYVTKKYHPF